MSYSTEGLQGPDLMRRLLDREGQRRLQPVLRKQGTTLFTVGARPTGLYYLMWGEVRLERPTRQGHTAILQRLTSGFVAEPSLTAEQYVCNGVCHTDSELYCFPLTAVRQAIDHDTEFRWAWIALLGEQARRQKARAERMSLKTVSAKLRHLIATEGDGDGRYRLTGTQAELASDLGITSEALYRTLSRLQGEKLLTVNGAILQLVGSPDALD